MKRKIPPDAFSFYASLAEQRSYQKVAERYGVTRRAVAKAADREKWSERLAEIERKAREDADQRLKESLAEMNARHLKVMAFIQGKAIEALKAMPLESAMDAIRAYAISLDKERLIRGEPSQRSEVSYAEVARRELDRFVTSAEANGDEEDW